MAAKLKEAARETRMVAAGHRALANENKVIALLSYESRIDSIAGRGICAGSFSCGRAFWAISSPEEIEELMRSRTGSAGIRGIIQKGSIRADK